MVSSVLLLRGGHQGIVQLYGKNNQDNLGKGLRIVEMDLPVLNPLGNNFGKNRFEFRDKMGNIFLMEKKLSPEPRTYVPGLFDCEIPWRNGGRPEKSWPFW